MTTARLAFLWHMHQPMYTDPETGRAVLPWVRLHATQSYYDMARMVERFPEMRATVNFVPSLIEQLQGAASGSLPEHYVEISKKRPEELSADERLFVLRQFFMANRDHAIKSLPRYWELLQRRGEEPAKIDPDAFDDADIRDIQVLFNLAWMGFSARAEESAVSGLIAKGRDFTEDDKATLLDTQQRILQRVLPLWRTLSETGRVELSTTPYFHPILPLLCDSDSARRAMPKTALPPRFAHPQDARTQVQRAIALHREAFGKAPIGMWPAEGSVSPEALEIIASEGLKWAATDEGVLFRSTPKPATRGELYQPWEFGSLGLAFRDHSLSDRIGFTYANMPVEDAVADFVGHVRDAAETAANAGIAEPLVPVILDGENAWEYFDNMGEEFLSKLYTALSEADDIKTATMSEALAKPRKKLTAVHSGSWIDSNFHIWIGHPEDNLAWDLLGQVRALLAVHEERGDVAPDKLERARTLVFSAEGSDWFWWYGDDFVTANAAEFDFLFRDRLLRACALLGETAPARLSEPISQQARDRGAMSAGLQLPKAIIHPNIDGRFASKLQWMGAGLFVPKGGQGAMFNSTRLVTTVYFGGDLERVYLRIESSESLEGAELALQVSNGRGAEQTIAMPIAKGALKIPLNGTAGAFGDVIELALPLNGIGLKQKDRAQLSIRVKRGGKELDRVPARGSLAFEIPGPDFEQRMWLV